MKVSVIIPTYKPQKYLWECLEALYQQTFSRELFEVIIVLNGEKDPFYSQIKNFTDSHPELSWIFLYTERSGVSHARNIALDIAKGEYVTFIDDDDYVSNNYLKLLCEKASEDIVSLCYPLSFEEGSQDYHHYHITNNYDKCCDKKRCSVQQARSYFSGPVYKLIHRNIIGNARYDERFKNGEDSLFMFLISYRIKGVSFTSKDAVYYRRFRKGSASLSKRSVRDHLYSNSKQIIIYTKYFLSRPFKYNFLFYLSRCGGCLYDMLHSVIKRSLRKD